jgi:hypothetical protein
MTTTLPKSVSTRTPNYGRVNSLDEQRQDGSICSVPIHFDTNERWICHIIYPSFHSIFAKGDFGTYIVLVDNFGELYYWSGNRCYSEILVYPANDKDADIYKKEDMNKFIIKAKENRSFAFTDDFIDILKSSYIPFDSHRIECNRVDKPSIGIDKYVETLLQKNRKILEEVENLESLYNSALEEQYDYKPISLAEPVTNREKILSAVDNRLSKERMRGFITKESSDRFHIKLNTSIDV